MIAEHQIIVYYYKMMETLGEYNLVVFACLTIQVIVSIRLHKYYAQLDKNLELRIVYWDKARLSGQLWVKPPSKPNNPSSSYTLVDSYRRYNSNQK